MDSNLKREIILYNYQDPMNRGLIEDCKDCISYVYLSLQELDKKLTPVEEVYSNVGIRKN